MANTKTKVASSYKYASKMTGRVLDKLIEAQLGKMKKGTKVTEKFLLKMKLAVQKKISLLSRDAFTATPVSAKSLSAEVAVLRKELAEKGETIKATAAKMLAESKPNLIPPKTPRDSVQGGVSFERQVEELGKTFEQVASRLSAVREQMKVRVEEMSTTLTEAERQWTATTEALEARGTGKEARGKDVAPAKALAAHLSGR